MPEIHSKLGYSAVSTFEQCPYRYKLQYIDGVRTLPTDDAANALVIGTALHKGIETDAETAIDEYFRAYPIISDAHVVEEIKLRHWIPIVKGALPDGLNETMIQDTNFIGTADYLAPVIGDAAWEAQLDTFGKHALAVGALEYFDLYDFKYSNNIARYRQSRQLHLYKYYFEKTHPGKMIRRMYFVFVPKIQIKHKKTETEFEFRQRLDRELDKVAIRIEEVQYDPAMVIEHLELTQQILQATEYPKHPTRLCDWCDHKNYCQEGDVSNMLPSTARVSTDTAQYKKIWIYGQPFSGKTFVCDAAPVPLNLNTDGNVKAVTMARLPIKDTMVGRQKKLAWEVFKEAIDELEAGSDFKTIIVDLLEDTYESCRLYMYKQMGITHESDDSFRAWDKVRTEFLSTMRRLLNLDYNVILISHEDMSKDITKRTGDKVTAIKPNITDKIANKIAGMVDIVIRAVKDENLYTLSTKTSNVVFGGGRLTTMKAVEVRSSWDAIEDMYGTQSAPKPQPEAPAVPDAPKPEDDEPPFDTTQPTVVAEQPTEPAIEPEVVTDTTPRRRVRRTRQ